MKYTRFRNPSGAVRKGSWSDEEGEIRFGNESYSPDEVDVLAPCEPSKVVCVGLNYEDHAAELDERPPDRPRLFFKPPNTIAGHGDTVRLPSGKDRLDYEAELVWSSASSAATSRRVRH